MNDTNLTVEYVPIEQLKPADYNPRKWSESARKGLTESLNQFGFVQPIVVNSAPKRKGIIIGGNFKLDIAREKGMDKVPVVWVNIPDIKKEKELNLRLNKNQGEFDDDLLAEFDIDLLLDVGWDDMEIEDIFAEESHEDNFNIQKEIESIKVVTQKGDVWQLGRHRLMCGDSTIEEDVRKLMDGQQAVITFTSPPYWLGFEYENEDDRIGILDHIAKSSKIMSQFVKGKIVINTGNINSLKIAEKLTGKKQPAFLIDWWTDALNKNNYLLRHIRIWAKQGGVMPSRKNDKIDMHWEYLATFTEESGNAGFIATFRNAIDKGGIKKGTAAWAVNGIWTDIHGNARQTGHVAAFPIELPYRYYKMYSEAGDVVYEPYTGSGTSIIAAEKLKRKCYGMELDPKYVDLTIRRWELLTGEKAIKI